MPEVNFEIIPTHMLQEYLARCERFEMFPPSYHDAQKELLSRNIVNIVGNTTLERGNRS